MSFDLVQIWNHMGMLAKVIAGVLVMFAVASIGVVIERTLAFAKGAKESREFAKQDEVDVPAEVLKRYAGFYPLAPTFVLTVTTEGDKLFVQATGQPKYRVFAKSETEWFYKVVDAQLTFQVSNGKCTGLVLHQNGRDMPAKKR